MTPRFVSTRMRQSRLSISLLSWLCAAQLACGASPGAQDTNLSTVETGSSSAATASELESSSSEAESESGSSGVLLDTPADTGDTSTGGAQCVVDPGDGAAPPPCIDSAPAMSFEPVVQWSWSPEGSDIASVVTPLVINLTDDDNSGDINLCDIPDVVVVTYDAATSWPAQGGGFEEGHIHILSGDDGHLIRRIEQNVDHSTTPAVGDVDGDGLPEIISANRTTLFAFTHEGEIDWQAPMASSVGQRAIALADLDNDGDVEIIVDRYIYDHQGTLVTTLPRGSNTSIPVDLDGDGDLEIVAGFSAWHHDGTELFDYPGEGINFMTFTAVGDLDNDGLPEIVSSGADGVWIFENDGTVKISQPGNERSPPAIMDMDGDGTPEIAVVADGTSYRVLDVDLNVLWSSPVADGSGAASGTAFDFLGDGSAETMYADETQLFLFDPFGVPVLTQPRTSWTQIEYPVVADVDNDGSAEIVVVSNDGYSGQNSPTVQVIKDADDRWIQARRIWNEHVYHVTNVYEDGTIPTHEAPNWETFNTFRVNAQILSSGGGTCIPPVG